MNTQIIQLNDISIVLCWKDEENNVYVTYHKNFQQIMDFNVFSSLEQEQIGLLVNNYCQHYSLNLLNI
jgi:hypothetical protein